MNNLQTLDDICNNPQDEIDFQLAELIRSENYLADATAEFRERANIQAAQRIITPTEYPEIKQSKSHTKVHDTTNNFKYLIEQKRIELKYNLMSRSVEVTIPGEVIHVEDKLNMMFTLFDNICQINHFPSIKWRLQGHIKKVALENSFHPLRDAIKRKPWDGIKRLQDLFDTIPVKDARRPHRDTILLTWLTSAVAAAYSDSGFTAHGVLVLQGAQGIGKTTWIKNLTPFLFNAVGTGFALNPKIKDDLTSVAKYWIVEFGELDGTFKKSEMAILKSYLTRSQDDVRRPYAMFEDILPRRTVFAASVNEMDFLVDQSGNRRWWTIEVTGKINYNHELNMQQIWAEIYHYWRNGGLTYLTQDLQEQVNITNEEHIIADPMLERLQANYDWDTSLCRKLTPTEIALEMGIANPEIRHTKAIANAIRKLTDQEKPSSHHGKKVYKIPNRLIKSY